MFFGNAITTGSSVLRDKFWTKPYSYIYHINACLEGLEKAGNLTLSLRNKLRGELKLCRAYCYLQLVNYMGAVPLVMTTDYRISATIARTTVEEVYRQIESDLLSAKNFLTVTYPSVLKGRPNKWTATGLLARVYLYLGEWAKAETEAAEIIASGQYSLVSNLNGVFLTGSTETIWQLFSSITSQNNTAEGFLFIPASATARPNYPISSQLMSAFQLSDQRRASWLKSVTVSSQVYWYPYKYKVRGGSSVPVTEALCMLRLAEIYLIRAEARARQGNISGGLTDLNQTRSRAGLPALVSVSESQLLAEIFKERRLELFCELGQRWFDLKRTGLAASVLAYKPGWNIDDVLFPIPEAERERNPFLTQNPGY
jgi:hypothetical protein